MKYILRRRILRCKILFLFILLTYHGQNTFCSDSVEKICPLWKELSFRRNCHNNFKDDVYPSAFYNTNSHDSADWKCHAACWIFGEIRKLKSGNI